MKIVILIAFIVLFLALLLPYLNFQVYINALGKLGYLGEIFAGIITAVIGLVEAITQFEILLTIILIYGFIAVINWIFDLF